MKLRVPVTKITTEYGYIDVEIPRKDFVDRTVKGKKRIAQKLAKERIDKLIWVPEETTEKTNVTFGYLLID